MQLQKLRNRFSPLWHALSKRRRKQLVGLQVLSLAAAVGEAANLGTLLPFLRLLANPEQSLNSLGPLAGALHNLPQQHLLVSLGLGFMAVVVISTVLRVTAIRSQLRLSALITADLGEKVFAVVLHRNYAWHLRTNSSAVLSYLTEDVNAVLGCVQSLLLLGMNALIVLLLGSSLIAIAPVIMIVVGALLSSFYVLVLRFTRAQLRNDGAVGLMEYQRSMQIAQESLGSIRDILIDHNQATFVQAYRQSAKRKNLAQAAFNIKAQVPRYFIEGFTVLLIIGVSLTLALQGQGIDRQIPMLGTLALGAYRLLQPLQQCFGAVVNLQANQVAIQRLAPFLSEKLVPVEAFNPGPLDFVSQSGQPLIQLKDLSFRYSDDGPWVLRDLQLDIKQGERLAFVGTTGSGKSTTSDLILGLLKPSEGQILVCGHDLHANPGMVPAWQARIAHVPQQIYLSDASYAANIAFGVTEDQIDLDRVRKAAEQARISDLIESSYNGYASLVGERGVRLSGGQRQRIGIARALYKQANVLVLDEATSALDNRTEAEVMQALQLLDRHITVILIAHRLSTVEKCDRVVLLEKGRIAGCGRYDELQAYHKTFQELVMPVSTSQK
jgi:ATP-binding cassette subfamily B protein